MICALHADFLSNHMLSKASRPLYYSMSITLPDLLLIDELSNCKLEFDNIISNANLLVF